ncbi:MAG: TIGR00282 family metallophosphoesterase [Spirochaetes bacterium]|nr:TIGR00282 family metallophosphoesterase [Spirochaetota bacterium]
MKSNIMNILLLGDIIGSPGIEQLFVKLPQIKKQNNIDLTIVNGENADQGFGITDEIIHQLKSYGVDVITSGNHIWSNRDADQLLDKYDYLLRPANYPDSAGKGYCEILVGEVQIGIVNLLGRYFMIPLDCPFQTLEKLIKSKLKKCQLVIVDFHAESPQEKKALAFAFDGQVQLIVGTHTHVQSADEVILPGGTGYISDLGMCGGIDSIIGMQKDGILTKMKNQINVPFSPARDNGKVQGVVVQLDVEKKQTLSIARING